MKSVLFVCWGNICRSPAAEGVLRHALAERGLEGAVDVESAGTISYHQGEPPDERMRQAAAARGWDLQGASRPVETEDFDRFDLIVAMDSKNLADLQGLEGQAAARVRLFSDFLPAGSPEDVPDPYYGGERGFDRVLDLLELGMPSLLEELLEEDLD